MKLTDALPAVAGQVPAEHPTPGRPQGRGGEDHRHHRDGDENAPRRDWQVRGPERRDRPQCEDPGLRVDRLEGRGLEQPEGSGEIAPLERPCPGDPPGELEEISRAGELHRDGDLRNGRDESAQAGRDGEGHRAEPERGAQDVRCRPAEAERSSRGPQRDVVGPGRHRAHEAKPRSAPSSSTLWTLRPGGHRVLYDPAMVPTLARTAIRAWKPPVPGIREVLHARFTDRRWSQGLRRGETLRIDCGRSSTPASSSP